MPGDVEPDLDIPSLMRSPINLDFARNEEHDHSIQRLFRSIDIYHDDAPHAAAMNMAIDEALLEYAAVPTIRFYQWKSPALSFGYFGRFSDISIYAGERDLVRRWTGGGTVFHGEDLTYAIVIPRNDPAFGESSIVIYEKIHRALCEALLHTGEQAVVAGGVDPTGVPFTSRTGVTYNCFTRPVRADVMMDGRKIAGAAQRRTHSGLLQQGSIQGFTIKPDLAQKFANTLSSHCSEFDVTDKILPRAREIARHKYGTGSWLRKR